MKVRQLRKLICVGLISGSFLFGGVSEAGIVTDRMPLQCYADHQVNTYNTPGAAKRAGYISANVDLIKITQVRGDGWCYGSYPGAGGKRVSRWFRITDVCADAGYTNRSANVRGKQTVYRTRSGGATLGSVSNNEGVIVVADNGSRAQIVYRLDNGTGYKLGWVSSSAVAPTNNSPATSTHSINHNPVGAFESYGTLDNALRVIGWAEDADNLNHKVRIHVYIGGAVGNPNAYSKEIKADKAGNAHSGHVFDDTLWNIPSQYCGRQTIRIYALNDVGPGSFQEIGSKVIEIPTKNSVNQYKTIANGWYNISPMHDLRRVLDVNGSDTSSGANIHMWSPNGGHGNQKFYLQNRADGWFSLKVGHCDNYVTADGNGVGANLSSRPWNGSSNQLFKLVDGGGGSYHVIAKVNPNLNFDCAGGWKNDGVNVQLWTKENNSAHHKWKFISTDPPTNNNNSQPVVQERDGYIKTSGANLYFRQTPNGTILGKLSNGTSITVLQHPTTTGWSKIRYNGTTGYVASQYVVIGKLPNPDNKIEAAMRYIASLEGRAMDYDGVYGAQCVDLIKYYYKYLGVANYARGNGKDYATNTLPPNWKRIKGAEPQKGDILVYTTGGGGYGHVAIAESPNVSWHQNFNGKYVRKITGNYRTIHVGYWGVIRPVA